MYTVTNIKYKETGPTMKGQQSFRILTKQYLDLEKLCTVVVKYFNVTDFTVHINFLKT